MGKVFATSPERTRIKGSEFPSIHLKLVHISQQISLALLLLFEQDLQDFLQKHTLALIAEMIGKASGRDIMLTEARGWTVQDYMTVHYQVIC